ESGIGKDTEAQPLPAPVFTVLAATRANAPVAGMDEPTPGSTLSITSTAGEFPSADETDTVKFGLPTIGGEMALICGVNEPEPARPVPLICGTRSDSVYSVGRSNGAASELTRG